MGIFGSKKTFVASSLQNLAGLVAERPNYLKTTVIGNIIADQGESISDTIVRSYLHGPGLRLRNFFYWCLRPGNYDQVGMPSDQLGLIPEAQPEIVQRNIPHGANTYVNLQSTEFNLARYSYWAEQWMMANEPFLLNTAWKSDIRDSDNLITITFVDTTTASFYPVDFVKGRLGIYVFSVYFLGTGSVTDGIVVTGPDVVVPEETDFPSTAGWTYRPDLSTTTHVIDDMRKETWTQTIYGPYDEQHPGTPVSEDPQVVVTYSNAEYDVYEHVYYREYYAGTDPNGDRVVRKEEWMHLFQTGQVYINDTTMHPEVVGQGPDPGGGDWIYITFRWYIEEFTDRNQKYRIDYRLNTDKAWNGPYTDIYRYQTGRPELDAMIDGVFEEPIQFYPFIPIRVQNRFVSWDYPAAYAQVKEATYKALAYNYDDLEADLATAPSLPDIDYAYLVFGVPFNTPDNAAQKYIYNFMNKCEENQGTDELAMAFWMLHMDNYQADIDHWQKWKMAQGNPADPLYGTFEPTIRPYPNQPGNNVRITGSGPFPSNFDMEITWNLVTEYQGVGLAKPGAKNGEVWIVSAGSGNRYDYDTNEIYQGTNPWILADPLLINKDVIFYQVSQTAYKYIVFEGFTHRNYIYKGKIVETTFLQAISDPEESGFLFPLHDPTLKQMSLVDVTQMTTDCTFMVFNSYVVKKSGIFGSLFFKIFLIVVIVVILVYAPQLAPTLSKAALATGTFIVGTAGTVAIIIGAIANAVIAMIITKVLTKIAVEVFGAKWGTIIGMIASTIAIMAASSAIAPGSFSANFAANFGNMLSAENIMKLTAVTGRAVQSYVMSGAVETMQETEELLESYKTSSFKIQQMLEDLGASDKGELDPLLFTDAFQQLVTEEPQCFIDRTLMTGMDIAEMSHDMLNRFAEATLSTDLTLKY